MELSFVPSCEFLEMTVVLFQIFGVGALCLTRLFPHTRWAKRARVGYVLALLGLGVAGALCGRHDSQFALFAGVTMTVLLIGMISGGSSLHVTAPRGRRMTVDTAFAA